jgi:iron complex transport system ATP-binding protein
LPRQTKKTPSAFLADSQPPLIEYRNVTVSRNNRLVLNGITLAIGQGEHVAILGPNGAGKSFLIRTITRESYHHAGIPGSYVRILGQESWNVFEEIILSGFFSSIGIWPHHRVTPAMERKVRGVMHQLEIGHLAERKMNEISSGEARRVLIGRALVHDPQALILDEPSASLDFLAAHELRSMLRKIARAGTSIVMVTHNLTDIIPEISRVILLKDGGVFDDGAKEEVLTPASLQRLFGIPLEVVKRDGFYYML